MDKPNKDIEVKPIYEGQQLDENCWFVFEVKTDEKPVVLFVNPNQTPQEYADFDEFAQVTLDDCSGWALNDNNTHAEAGKKLLFSASDAKEYDDYDEGSGRSFTSVFGKAHLLEIYNGFDLNKLQSTVKEMEKCLSNMEESAAENLSDGISYSKDPYAYNGVRRKDFY